MISKLSSVSLGLNIVLLVSCGSQQLKGTPYWPGKLWAGDPAHGQVQRTQDPAPNTISAFDPQFKDMVCMSYADLSCMYFAFVNNCKDWFTLTPGCPTTQPKDVKKFISQYENYHAKGSVQK